MPESNTRPPRRPNAEYRWTRAKIMCFLETLAMTGSVARAARGVGMSRQSAYRLRARLGPRFGEVWDSGKRISADMRRLHGGPGGQTGAAQGDSGAHKVTPGQAR